MIRSELVELLAAENPGLTAKEVERIVVTFFGEISEQIAKGGRVELRGFGAFSSRARGERAGRNPRTGETVAVTAKRVPHFKPGKEIARQTQRLRARRIQSDLDVGQLSPLLGRMRGRGEIGRRTGLKIQNQSFLMLKNPCICAIFTPTRPG